MKGVILAGGNGTRLMPLTKAVNKHLLPVGDRPMLQHCVEKMVEAGLKDIMVVTGGEHLGGIAEFLGSGRDLGCRVTYRVQEDAGGIAQALALAEGFVMPEESVCVLLGDNIFQDSLKPMVDKYAGGAMVALKEVSDPERFGVATIGTMASGELRIIKIVEKPSKPESIYAVTGIYLYDNRVFDIIRMCKPSGRGEMEITDVNNFYVDEGKMKFSILKGWWTDAGTHESYRKANELVMERKLVDTGPFGACAES
jgi:glucose-1-phosphate thymidylyltransferase